MRTAKKTERGLRAVTVHECPICAELEKRPGGKVPNAATRKAMEEARSGKGVKTFRTIEAFYKDIGLDRTTKKKAASDTKKRSTKTGGRI